MAIFRRRRFCLTLLAALCMMFTFRMTFRFHKLLEQYAGPVIILSVEDPVIAFVDEAKQSAGSGTNTSVQRSRQESNFNAAVVKLLARKFRLRSMCQPRLSAGQTIHVTDDEYLKHIAVNDEQQLLVCANKEAHSSVLFQALVKQSGEDNHGTGVVEQLKYLNTLEPSQQTLKLRKYTKIVVVQDPLERLLETYRNKFKLSSRQRKQEHYENLVEFYKRHSHLSENSRTLQDYAHDPLSFQEYLVYWLDKFRTRENDDEQFMTYNDICRPCVTHYDYVIYTNDTVEVIMAIAKKLHIDISDTVSNNGLKATHKAVNKDLVDLEKVFNNVSKSLVSKVQELVCVDSVLFGFDVDENICTKFKKLDR